LLRVFLSVVESGGFSKAQIALNVSQSTISTQMIDLETRLGMRLCRRGRSGFALTEEGHEVFKYAKDLVLDCDEFVRKVNGIRGDLSGELRIAIADSLLGNKVFPFEVILAELRETMPAVVLHLSVMDPLEIERLVLEQKLHMGLHTFPNHPLFGDDLTRESGELEEYDYAARSYYGGALKTGNFKPKKSRIYAGSMEGIAAAILSGCFLGHLPVQCAQAWVEQGKMKPLFTEVHSYKVPFECVFPIGTRMANTERMLEEVMLKYSA
jgi:DNA-binding transcriptional LysR family regulator